MKTITRLVILVLVLTYTNIFGIVNLYRFTNGGFLLKDLALGASLGYLIFGLLTKTQPFPKILKNKITILVLLFLFLITVTILLMPLRAEVSIIGAFKVARNNYSIVLFIIALLNIYIERDTKFLYNLIITLGTIYSVIVVLNVFFPSFTSNVFQGMTAYRSENVWSTKSTRTVIKANSGILFIYLSFIIYTFRFLNKKRDYYMFGLVLFAMFFQGWRAPLISAILGTIIVIILYYLDKIKFLIKYVIAFTFIIIISDIYIVPNGISGKFLSAYYEITMFEGTFAGREKRNKRYMIPKFLEKPIWGWGYIHKESETARDIGYYQRPDKSRSLYSIDSGYLTMLVTHGIMGTIIILSIFVTMLILFIKKVSRASKHNYYEEASIYFQSGIAFLLLMMLSNYTFTTILHPLGLLPFSLISALAEGKYYLQKKML